MATSEVGRAGIVEYDIDGRLISEMKVDELKTQLERRGLKKSGNKKDLQERLREHMEKEKVSMDVSSSSDAQSSATQERHEKNDSQESESDVHKDTEDQNQKSSENKKDENEKDQGSDSTELNSKGNGKQTEEIEDGEIVVTEEDKKNQKANIPEKKRRISLTRQKSNTTPNSGTRKRKWSSMKNKSSVVISTDSLKELIPGVQLASTPALEAVMDFDDDKEDEEMAAEKEEEGEKERKEERKEEEKEEEMEDNISDKKQDEKTSNGNKKIRIVHVEESKTVKLNQPGEADAENSEMEVTPSHQETSNEGDKEGSLNRDEDLPSSTASSEANFKAKRAVSPPRNPPSNVIHVTNLVRPFTQIQLNQLLSQYGTLVEGGFWINKIKSHCYVTYSSVDDAKTAREALHGQCWPNTSPKILNVDFGDEEQMMEDTEGVLGKKKTSTEKKEKENERDVDKGQESRRHKERKEQKPKEEPSAANLLDKLFRKTITQPSIYWLPLTKEQIAKRESERDERRKQRQLALQEEEKQQDERLKGRENERESGKEKERETGKEKERETGREKERETGKEKERETGREKERETGKEKERETGRGKEREAGRRNERETGRERERETGRGKDREVPRGEEHKPFRENRTSSPPTRSRLDRRSPDIKRRSRSRSKGLTTRRDDRKR